MNKYLILSSVTFLFLTVGCNQKKIERLQAQQDSLMNVTYQKEANLNELVSAFNEIEANLDSIKKLEKVIDKNAKGGEVKGSRKEQIKSDIAYIYALQVKNRKLLADLNSKLNKSTKRSSELQKMVENLNQSLNEKDAQIASLTDELGRMNIQVQDLNSKVAGLGGTVDSLFTENYRRNQVIEDQTAALNTAYYVVGTNKDLKEKKLITAKGGFIGIGRTKEITPDADMSSFNRIDIISSTEIPLHQKKVAVVTPHPKASYRIEGEGIADKLVILDPTLFWSLSKALVIMIK